VGQHTWTGDEVGRLFQTLGNIEGLGKEQGKQIGTLFRKVDELGKTGCAVGTANEHRIHALEDAPKPTARIPNGKTPPVLTISLGAAGLTAIVGAIIAYLKFKGG